MQANVTMDKLVALCKNRGFVFAGSEIYGGLSNTWDYGPLGVELCNNIKKAWWKRFVQESPYNVGMDSAILMNPQTWVASGHVGSFSDPLMDCKACKSRFRADKLIEDYAVAHELDDIHPDGWTNEQMQQFIADKGIVCPECGKADFTPIRKFNLMFKTFQGVTEDTSSELFLRPETCQGIFVNFRNVQRTTRRKIPFGICQIGKSFRNEITPGNFVFRTREFEQMEMEFFCKPGTDLEWYAYWKEQVRAFLLNLGIKETSLRFREHEKEELSHYSRGTTDAEFLFPFGWGELWGVADRGDFDLNAHSKCSGESFEYLDPFTNERYVPCCVEPSVGVGRLLLAFLTNAYEEEQLEKESRVVLHLHPALAPFKAAVLPLSKKLAEPAMAIHNSLSKLFAVDYDDVGSIGKRYRREDEIGTPFCITVDFETENDGQVTLRNRDDMTQIRLPISELGAYISQRLDF